MAKLQHSLKVQRHEFEMDEILSWTNARISSMFYLSSDFCPVGTQSETLWEKVVGLQAVRVKDQEYPYI